MKRLILLLLIPLFACSHEHPLTDHQHDHEHTLIAHEHNLTDHEHDLAEHTHDPAAYPGAYIVWEDTELVYTDKDDFGIGELDPFGGRYAINFIFSKPPIGLTVTNVPDPYGLPTIPINGWALVDRSLAILTRCSQDMARAGGHNLAVQLDWHSGGKLVRYACPDWSKE